MRRTKVLTQQQAMQIDMLWNALYSVKLKDRFSLLLQGVDNFMHYMIEDEAGNVQAWAVYFEKEDKIRFSILVSKAAQGKGLGRQLIDALKADLPEFYGWVTDHNNDLLSDGSTYISPLPFYLKQGFKVLDNVRLDTEMIQAVMIHWDGK
jgi:GNAT superfamily N-acetyltransferase